MTTSRLKAPPRSFKKKKRSIKERLDFSQVSWDYLKDSDGNYVQVTISYFIQKIYPITDCNPVGQRPAVIRKDDDEKNVEIISSILTGIDVTQITLVKTIDGKWKFESLDGGHRKRAIRAFMSNKFKVDGRYYSELSEEEQEAFGNYKMTIIVYEPMDTFMKGYIFDRINKITKVEQQETLNAHGDTPIANAVRETVRVMTMNGRRTKKHDFFETTSKNNFKWTSLDNIHLKLEEFVAKYYYRFYDGGDVGSKTFENIKEMYLDITPSEVKKVKKKVDDMLTFILSMAEARKDKKGSKGMGSSELNTLANLYLYLHAQYGDWILDDVDGFYCEFGEVFSDMFHDPDSKWGAVVDFDFEDANTVTIKECFKNYATDRNSGVKQKQQMKWILEYSNVVDYITVLDDVRGFPNYMKEIALQRQGYVCAIDGKPLKWEDAHAAHKIAHSKGGLTTLDNCAMVRAIHNTSMGSMSVDEYEKIYKSAA